MATTKKAKSGSTKKESKSKDVKGKDRKSKDLKRKDAKKKDAKKKDTKKKDTKKKSGKKGTSKKSSASKPAVTTETAALRIPSAEQTPTAFRLGADWTGEVTDLDPRATPGFAGDKTDGKKLLVLRDAALDDLQERLYAAHHGEKGGRSVLLVVQGMDTSGKGGIMRHVVGAVDPQGVDITAFKAPTPAEKRHDFLWRIRKHTPVPGKIAVFDRSHYEDVLIHRVHGWADEEEIQRRYEAINAFEQELTDAGTTVVKVMLHISAQEQGERLMERLDRADKHWKFNPGDIDERAHWEAYMEAYTRALRATSTEVAPWTVVPADRKWYARIAVQELLLEALEDIDPQWPVAEFDVAEQKERLRATMD